MALPHLPHAVVFDMDGLLIDSETLYQEAGILAAAEGGHDLAPELLHQTLGLPSLETRLLLLGILGADFPIDAFQAAWRRHFWVIAETRLTLKPGVIELLDALDELSMPRAIATSSSRQTVDRHLQAHDLIGRFNNIVAHGDYDNGKPDPAPFLKAAERLRVEPRLCLALEDSYNGVRSAASAGMMTVMVPDILPPTDEIRGLCSLVAADLFEVRDLILSLA